MLTIEWRRRIDNWRREVPYHFYRPLDQVELKGFVTTDQLTVDRATAGPFQPMPPGTHWGAKWEYGWFAGQVTLPEEARGKRIALVVDVGAESAVYVNGAAVGETSGYPGALPRSEPSRGWRRGGRFDPITLYHEITLAKSGVPGTRYEIAIEGYAGHGPRVSYAGPTPPGRETVPEPPATQATIGQTTFGVWQEDVYQLWLDVETLYEVRDNIDPESLRVAEIDAGLRDFTTIVDFELPNDEMLGTVRACRERLRPLLECVNGSTAPTMYAFGHAHIDVAWLWPLAETERKCVRTFAAQLSLMEQYPEYMFLQSQPHLYQMVKDHYPKLYERIKKAVASGQFVPEGGMWVEADTNISGGESLIRQFIHGKRFFREEFGVESVLMWLPDVFGYSGAMPQIMVGCAIKYFSTQKIFWAYNGGDPFPYNTFWWEGIDGSDVLVHLHNDYNSRVDPEHVILRWNERVQKNGFSTRLFPFGFGDGGGGPTRDHLEFIRRQGNLEGVPQVKITSPIDYFKDQEAKGVPERYVGELYFQAHRGTYTSQARTKPAPKSRTMPIADFYLDYARANFGKAVAEPLGELLARLDGVNLPEISAWKKGPGVLTPDGAPWQAVRKRYAFVEELAALRPRVKGSGNRERFDYWLHTYQAMAAMAEARCRRGQLDRAMAAKDTQAALATRIELARAWTRLMTLQTAIVRTPGELGTIANLEHQTRRRAGLVEARDAALVKALGKPLPPEAAPGQVYTGPAQLILPTVRTVVVRGESLNLTIMALDRREVKSVAVHLRPLGRGDWRDIPAKHVGRAVYAVTLPPAQEDFEYHVTAESAAGAPLVWPPTAPRINQTLVVAPAMKSQESGH